MGLRETKSARTRELIVDVATRLFLDQGYEATTLEEIAAAAEVGTTTLYRYFPTKELILFEPFASLGRIVAALRERPAEESLDVALGAALRDTLPAVQAERRIAELLKLLDEAPGPRARLWQLLARERVALEMVIAERLGRPSDDLTVLLTARTALDVLDIAASRWRTNDGARSGADEVENLIRELAHSEIVLPRL